MTETYAVTRTVTTRTGTTVTVRAELIESDYYITKIVAGSHVFSPHDIDTKVAPDSRGTLRTACVAVDAEMEASPEWQAAHAEATAREQWHRDFDASTVRIERAGRGQ